MKQVLVDPTRPFDEMLSELMTLPIGRIIQRCGILQSEDFPQWAVDGLRSMGKDPGLLPKALEVGYPTYSEMEDALQCIYDAEHSGLEIVYGGRKVKNPRYFYISTQGNFLANAQKVSNYMKGEPTLCFETIPDDDDDDDCIYV